MYFRQFSKKFYSPQKWRFKFLPKTEKHKFASVSLTMRDFKVISDLVHVFMNFNTLKIIFKIYKKILIKKDPALILTQGNLLVA